MYLFAKGISSCKEIKIMAPAAKDIKNGFKTENIPTAISPSSAPAGSASPETNAALKSDCLLPLPETTKGAAMANYSGIL